MQVGKLSKGIATTITDVTARHQHKEDLKRALNLNKSIIASSPFSIIVTDKAGFITSVNPAAEKMLWYQETELIGRDSIDLHDQEELRQRALDLSTQFDTEVYPDHHVFRLAPEKGLIDEREAVLRVQPAQLDQLLHPQFDPNATYTPVTTGLNASTGAAVGKVYFTADDAEEQSAER